MKGELRRKQILDCAKGLFSKKGYHNTHVEDILKEISIGKGTFYQYFSNKEELFISLLVNFLHDWEEAVLDTVTSLADEDIRIFYRMLIRRSLEFFRDNEDLCNIYLRVGPGTEKVFDPYIEQFEEKMLQYVIAALETGVKARAVRKDIDMVLMANILLGAFLRIDYYYFILKRQEKDSLDLERMADQFFNLIEEGIFTDERTREGGVSRSSTGRARSRSSRGASKSKPSRST
ncbi:MAG TPA: TetR/AcrR family transcriptional regulator [Deltaproteobacteria bacterium]|nr:TetR/AcrR family transcriptional regulator [Deltaproteobacteria bacterium]